jgi:multidrug resistance efflux pump
MRQAPGQQFEWLDHISALHAAAAGSILWSEYWVAGYFKETQLRSISTGDTATISLMGSEDRPFRGTVRSVGWGIFVTDGSSGENTLLPSVEGTALLPSVNPTIDWVRLPQRFPVRIEFDSLATGRLRIGQTASVAISHDARKENTGVIQ